MDQQEYKTEEPMQPLACLMSMCYPALVHRVRCCDNCGSTCFASSHGVLRLLDRSGWLFGDIRLVYIMTVLISNSHFPFYATPSGVLSLNPL